MRPETAHIERARVCVIRVWFALDWVRFVHALGWRATCIDQGPFEEHIAATFEPRCHWQRETNWEQI